MARSPAAQGISTKTEGVKNCYRAAKFCQALAQNVLAISQTDCVNHSPDLGLPRAAALFEAELHEHRLQLDHQR